MITLIGLGAGDESGLSLGARDALMIGAQSHRDGSGKLFLRTERHPVVEALRSWGLDFVTFDHLYDAAADFDILYAEIANAVLEAAGSAATAYAVPGHPLFGEESVRRLRLLAAENDVPVRIVSSGSFVEAVLTAAGVDLGCGCDIRDALTLPAADSLDRTGRRNPGRPDVTRSLLLFQVFDRDTASNTKLALMQDYPDEWEITLVRSAGISGLESVSRIPLFQLDRAPVDHLTSVYVPPLPPELRKARFPELVGMMARLRAPDGCPWDREQTPQSLRRYFIEETYEAIEAIDADDADLLREELGDVLLQVVFHAQIAAEAGDFNIDDVTDSIVTKLIRRHPHVFGSITVEDSEEVLRNWERIKKDEKKDDAIRRRDSVLDGIPKGLPALMQAMEVSKRVAKVGFEWESLQDVMAKLDEEVGELRSELAAPNVDSGRVLAELGDLIFTVVQIARWNRLDAEEALRSMISRFEKRFRYVEKSAEASGTALAQRSPGELDELWQQAKREA